MAPAAPAPIKYSRYAKVRHAQTIEQQATEPASAPAPASSSVPKTDTISRSMSRYRKSRPRAPASVPATPVLGSRDLKRFEDAQAALANVAGRSREDSHASSYNSYGNAQETGGREQRSNSNHMSSRDSMQRPSFIKRMSDQQAKRYSDFKSPPMIELGQGSDKKVEELLEKSKREDLARLEATLEAAGAQPVRGRAESQSTWNRIKRKMSRPKVDRESPPTSAVIAERKISTAQDALARPRGASERIIAGGNVRVDAPKGENAEGRKVDVRFKHQRQQFAISKTTTATDVITLAVETFNTPFRADAAVLKESYRSDGLRLERRLRLYELVTPVLNSWDRDTQNELILEASDSPRHDMDLLARGAPQEQPKPTSVHIYHSHLKGRWYKHWITLQTSGQIIMSSSKPEPGRNAKAEKLAHMTDFDIYTLSPDQSKGFKPKRKFCCVIKSQAKQTLFDKSPDKFVHFFSAGRAEDYQEWVDACQSWRSWHLRDKKDDGPSAAMNVPHSTAYNNGVHGQIDYAKNSSLPQQPRSYKPLGVNTSFGDTRYDSDNARKDSRDVFDEQYDSDYRSPISPHTRQIPFHLRHGSQGPTYASTAPIPQEPFHQGGLLGRSYSQRQRVLHENAPRVLGNSDFTAGAFTGGLLAQGANGPMGHTNGGLITGAGARNNSIAQRNDGGGAGYTSRPSTSHNNSAHTTPRTYAADALRRPSFAGSRPGTAGSGVGNGSFGNGIPPVPDIPMLPPGVQPLVDMTPEFKEAPQWRSEGKGRGVRVPQGVPLVDAAGSRWDKEVKEYHPEEFRRTNTLKDGYR